MGSSLKKKKLSYPAVTEGSRQAAETRRRANRLTPEQRREHFRRGMAIIYGGAQATKAIGSGH